METDGGGEPVSAPTHRWRTPLGERKGVRSTPSLDDGVERQVAHSSTEAAWLMSPHGHCLWARDCLNTVKESALKIPDARVYCGFLEVYVEGMTRVRLERARARRVRPAPRETRENVRRATREIFPANVFSEFDPPPTPPPTPPRGHSFRESLYPVCRPKFGSALGKSPSALCSFERRSPKSSTCRRGVDVTATLLALLRHKSRRRRAPRPDAGPPTHAIAGTRARAVTMATVRPPSLLNHSRRLASCRAPRHCRLSTPPSSRDGGVE